MPERENYCYLLGLNPLKESSYKPEDIQKKIAKCRESWANDSRNKQNDTEKRFKSERLVEMTEDMERVMKDPVLRRKEFTDGTNLLRGKSMKLLQDCVVLQDGRKCLIPGTIDSFMKKLRWDGVKEDDVIKLAGVSKDKPEDPAPPKVMNAYKSLRTVDVFTPVELMNRLIGIPILEITIDRLTEGSSLSQMRNAFEICEKRVNNVRPDLLPDQDSYINCLRTVKLVLNDDKLMHNLAEVGRCYRQLDQAIANIELEFSGRQLSRDYFDKLLRTCLGNGADTTLAIKILQQTCYKKKWPANFSDSDSEMDRCPHCGHMVPSGPNTMYCSSCGKELRVACPSCGTSQSPKNAVCIKCGFNFKEGMQKATFIVGGINTDISRGMIVRAEKSFSELKRIYPNHPNAGTIASSIEKAKMDMSVMKKMFRESYQHKRFAEAVSICNQLSAKYPEVLLDDLELQHKYSEAKSKVETADMYCRKAAAVTGQDAINLYISAANVCPDHPEAKNHLREFPPESPENIVGKLDNNGTFRIEFESPPTEKGISYCIYREKNAIPSVDEETRPLAEIQSDYFEDRALEPGAQYNYVIYAKRWGILSREYFAIGPIVWLAEVDGIMIEQIEGGLRLMFNKPRGASRVRVWRGVEGGGSAVELPVGQEPVYDDIGLTGGVHYSYLFIAEYDMHDRVERSSGRYESQTPIEIPEPVKTMVINRNTADGSFTAKWKSDERVVLYSSPKPLKISGTLVKMSDLESWMTRIEPLQEYVDGVRFNTPEGSVLYIYPIIPMGRFGVRGAERALANLKPFRDVERTVSNRNCIITMIWPPEAVAAKLIISDEGFKNGDDTTAEAIFVRREEYQREKEIRIKMGDSVKKYINLYAMYEHDGKMISAHGIALEAYSGDCKKVRYTYGDSKSPTIGFTTEESIKSLPRMVAVKASVGIPLKRREGQVVWDSEGPIQLSAGHAVLKVPASAIADPARTRLFFVDDGDYNLYRFVHPLYGRNARWRGNRRKRRTSRNTSARTASTPWT